MPNRNYQRRQPEEQPRRTRAQRDRDVSDSRLKQDPPGRSDLSTGSDHSERTFERHATILSGGELSHPANVAQRAAFVQRLQRDYGNHYVQRLVAHISRTSQGLQRKLVVGPAGDAYEREADQVAKDVMSAISTSNEPTTQRDGGEPEEEEIQASVQRQGGMEDELEDEVQMSVQRKGELDDDLDDDIQMSVQRVALIQRVNWSETNHFQERRDERGISSSDVDDALNSGTKYQDDDTGSIIYYKGGVAVITKGKTLITTYRGRVKRRWTKL